MAGLSSMKLPAFLLLSLLAACNPQPATETAAASLAAAAAPAVAAADPASLDAALLARLRADNAAAFASGDDLQIIEATRSWVYRHMDRSGPSLSMTPAEFTETFGQVFDRIDKGVGGFQCGGMAIVLSNIYKALGYQSWTYNFGHPPTGQTHVITLVQVRRNGKTIVAVEDSFHDWSLFRGKEPADFLDFLDALGRRDIGAFRAREGWEGCKPYIVGDGDYANMLDYYQTNYAAEEGLTSPSDLRRFCINNRLSVLLASRDAPAYLDAAELNGLPRNFLYLMLLPVGPTGTPEIVAAAQAARRKIVPDGSNALIEQSNPQPLSGPEGTAH